MTVWHTWKVAASLGSQGYVIAGLHSVQRKDKTTFLSSGTSEVEDQNLNLELRMVDSGAPHQ